ncbi:MAG TPA: hypothetical protein P5556_03455 [Candidatus Gastranaerophilales bacterium]|nr:hypothetical protein [Candidatus Gastranaerophilales bacterium]
MKKEIEKYQNFLIEKNFSQQLEELKNIYKDKKILIYGSGFLAQTILKNCDLSDFNIIGATDRNFLPETKSFCGYKAYSVFDIPDLNIDIIFNFVQNSIDIESFLKKHLEKYLSHPIKLIYFFE